MGKKSKKNKKSGKHKAKQVSDVSDSEEDPPTVPFKVRPSLPPPPKERASSDLPSNPQLDPFSPPSERGTVTDLPSDQQIDPSTQPRRTIIDLSSDPQPDPSTPPPRRRTVIDLPSDQQIDPSTQPRRTIIDLESDPQLDSPSPSSETETFSDPSSDPELDPLSPPPETNVTRTTSKSSLVSVDQDEVSGTLPPPEQPSDPQIYPSSPPPEQRMSDVGPPPKLKNSTELYQNIRSREDSRDSTSTDTSSDSDYEMEFQDEGKPNETYPAADVVSKPQDLDGGEKFAIKRQEPPQEPTTNAEEPVGQVNLVETDDDKVDNEEEDKMENEEDKVDKKEEDKMDNDDDKVDNKEEDKMDNDDDKVDNKEEDKNVDDSSHHDDKPKSKKASFRKGPSHSSKHERRIISSSSDSTAKLLFKMFSLADTLEMNNTLMATILNDNKRENYERRKADFGKSGYDGEYEVSYQHMQSVKLKMVFSRIMNIDTIEQQFDAEVYIQARWTEPNLQGLSEKELNEVPFEKCWNPRLKILNLSGNFEKDRLSIMIRYEDDQVDPVVTYMWYIKGIFLEPMELEHFPFDVQELSVAVSSDRPMDEIDLVIDADNASHVNPNAVKENQEWKSFRHVDFAQDYRTADYLSSSMHSVLVASCHVNRRLGFYMWNVFVIVFLILGLSLTLLSIDPTGTDRLAVTMTLFLTCVAFKLVVKTTLPTISYLTYLDVYVVFTLIYLAIQAAENAIVSHLARFREREKVLVYDEIAQSILIGLLILFHAIFLVYIQLTAFDKRRSMQDKDHAFHLNVAEKHKRGKPNRAERHSSKQTSKAELIPEKL